MYIVQRSPRFSMVKLFFHLQGSQSMRQILFADSQGLWPHPLIKSSWKSWNFILIYLVSVLLDCQLWSLCSKQKRFKFGEVARLKGNLSLAHLAMTVLEPLLQTI